MGAVRASSTCILADSFTSEEGELMMVTNIFERCIHIVQ